MVRAFALPLGARVLKLVSDWDTLESSGMERGLALETLQGRRGRYDPRLLEALVRLNVNVLPNGPRQVDLASLIVLDNGRVLHSSRLSNYVWS